MAQTQITNHNKSNNLSVLVGGKKAKTLIHEFEQIPLSFYW